MTMKALLILMLFSAGAGLYARGQGIRVSNLNALVSAGYVAGVTDTSIYAAPGYQTVNAVLSGTVSLMNVPLNMSYQYQLLQGATTTTWTGPAVQFNQAAFTRSLEARLQGKFNPADYLPKEFQVIDKMKSNALGDMQGDLTRIQTETGASIPVQGAGLNDWKTVNDADMGTLQKLIVPDSIQRSAASNQLLLSQLQAKKNNGQPYDTAAYNRLLTQNKQAQGYQQALQTIANYRKQWATSGLVNNISQLEAGRAQALQKIAGDPTIIGQAAKGNLSLNGMERLFTSMQGFNLGHSVADMSPMTLSQSVMQNGLNSQLLGSAGQALSMTGGHMPSQASSYEQMFSGNSFNPSMAMGAIGAGNGGMSAPSGSQFSLMSFKSSASGILPFGGAGGLSSFVLTFSRNIPFGAHGHLRVELSKSMASGGPGATSGVDGLLSTNDFFKTLGVSLDYNNEFPKMDLSHQVHLSTAATDYSNPGNAYLFSGMKEAESNLQKGFMGHHLVVTLRNSYTLYSMDPSLGSDHFSQFSHLLDARWKLKKGNYVSLKLQPSWSNQVVDGVHSRVGAITRYSADVNWNIRIKHYQYHQFASLAYVNNTFPDSTLGVGATPILGIFPGSVAPITGPSFTLHSWQLTTLQSLSIKSCQVFFDNTLVYAPNNSAYVYLNSTWNTEGGYQYPLNGNLSASTSLTYTVVADWYEQAGVKQSLSGRLSSHCTLTAYIDLGRNLVVLQSYPVPGVRGDVLLSYHF